MEDMKTMIGIKIDQELKEFLQEMADDENRSVSSFVINAILTYIKDHKEIDWKKIRKKSKSGLLKSTK